MRELTLLGFRLEQNVDLRLSQSYLDIKILFCQLEIGMDLPLPIIYALSTCVIY